MNIGSGTGADLRRRQIPGSSSLRGDASGFLRGVRNPLIQCCGYAPTLGLIFNHHKAHEVTAAFEADAHWVLAREHAVEHERHVFGVEELTDGEHARPRISVLGQNFSSVVGLRVRCGGVRNIQDLLRQGEHTWFAGDKEKIVMRFTTEPAGPTKATVIHRTIKSVARQRVRNETG